MTGDKVTTEEQRESKSAERRPIARRHHWISKLYLKAFAVPRKHKMQTTVFDRQGMTTL
jgi:hypothetical protein